MVMCLIGKSICILIECNDSEFIIVEIGTKLVQYVEGQWSQSYFGGQFRLSAVIRYSRGAHKA